MKLNQLAALAVALGVFGSMQANAADAPAAASGPDGHHWGAHKMNADTNGDGKISHDEFLAASQKRAEEHFKRMDTNNDGFVDQAERKAAFEQMRARREEWRAHHTGSEAPKPEAAKPN